MRWLLSLCLAGLLAYALIPPRTQPVQDAPVQDADAGLSTGQTEAAKAAGRELRSWGSTLQSLGHRVQPAKSQHSDPQQPFQQEADYRPGGVQAQTPEPALGTGDPVASETDAQIIEAIVEPVAWARIAFGARAHSEASVSSPIIKFYPAGTELPVVAREGAWIRLLDPATKERGWVFDKYVVSIDAPSAAQPALASTVEAQSDDAVAPEVQTERQLSTQAAVSNNTEITREARHNGRWVKRQDRRERKLRRLFGRNARPAAWSIGSPR